MGSFVGTRQEQQQQAQQQAPQRKQQIQTSPYTTMKLTRINSNNSGYWPDDLPSPSSNTNTVEIHYLQCGCTIQDAPSDTLTAFYGDVESWSPASSTQQQADTLPRSASPAPSDRSRSQSVEAFIVRRIVDSGFCEKTTCGRSKVFSMFFFFFPRK